MIRHSGGRQVSCTTVADLAHSEVVMHGVDDVRRIPHVAAKARSGQECLARLAAPWALSAVVVGTALTLGAATRVTTLAYWDEVML